MRKYKSNPHIKLNGKTFVLNTKHKHFAFGTIIVGLDFFDFLCKKCTKNLWNWNKFHKKCDICLQTLLEKYNAKNLAVSKDSFFANLQKIDNEEKDEKFTCFFNRERALDEYVLSITFEKNSIASFTYHTKKDIDEETGIVNVWSKFPMKKVTHNLESENSEKVIYAIIDLLMNFYEWVSETLPDFLVD